MPASRSLCVFAIVAALAAPAHAADDAASFPNGKTITIVIPFPPGGGVDAIARGFGERLSQKLGVPVVIDNKAGGSTALATTYVARATPDGLTLFIGTPGLSVNFALQPHVFSGDPRQTLAPVGRLATLPYVFAASSALPAKDVPGAVAWAKANPEKLTLANSGQLTATRMAAELFALRAGIKHVNVPYRGGGPAATDIIAGRVHGTIAQLSEVLAMLPSGVRAFAVTSRERAPLWPDVPAIAEFYPGFDVTSWNGVFAPAGTPEPILDRLNVALNAAIDDEGLRGRFREQGVSFVGGKRQDLADHLDREIRGWVDLQQKVNIPLN